MTKATKKLMTRFLSAFMIALLIVSNPGMLGIQNGQASADMNYDDLPTLLITELMPQSSNVDGKNAYEYIEVYNNTDKEMSFEDYQIIYRYPGGPEDDVFWTPEEEERDIKIPSGEALVLWVKPANKEINALTDEDFNENYGLEADEALTMGEDLMDMPDSGAMHNQRLRDILIRTNTGKEIVRAQYNKAEFDVKNNKGISYSYPEDGSTKMKKEKISEDISTPGKVPADYVPEQKVSVADDVTPDITDRTNATQPLDNVVVEAEASDDFLVSTVTLEYKKADDDVYHRLNLEDRETEGVFKETIPFQDIIGADEVDYRFKVHNGINNITTKDETVTIETSESGNTPPLLITELAPDSQNEGTGTNVYEFIEVYNNTDEPIDFGDYHVLYRYPSGTADLVWFEDMEDAVIGPEENLILWIDNGSNSEFNEEDFKNNYDITEDIHIVKGPAGAGMANGAERDMIIATDTGEEIVSAGYNKPGSKNDVVKDMGIFYHYPIDSNDMIKVRAGETATPGTVEADLVPDQANTVDPDAEPTIEDKSDIGAIEPGDSFDVSAIAEDDFLITQMTLHYKHSEDDEFTSIDLKRDDERLFHHTIDIDKDAEAGHVEYYFAASNSFQNTETETKEVDIDITSVPDLPSNPSPENESTDIGSETSLSVDVSDKLGGELDVTFFQGESFNTSKTDQVKIFENATDVEPPKELVPEGETELSEEDYEKLSELNGDRVSLDSDEQFPYQRFEVTLDDESLQQDEVEAVWNGSSLEGRKVSLYAWNLETEVWDLVDAHVADSEDTFTLLGDVSVADYVDGQTLNILVQDEIQMNDADSDYEIGDEPDFADFDFNFAWLADTQFYTEVFPWHYENQVNWIADNKDNFDIEYVIHSGDIVNTWNRDYQWQYADEYMKVLEDADVPYGILAGNHDVKLPEMDYINYEKYFGADRFEDQPYYGESFQNNRGHYDLISVAGIDFIMVHMGWQPQDDGIAWMNEVLEKHPDRIGILNFHQYLDEKDITPMGEKIFDEVVVPNENVQMVVGGHHFGANFMESEVENADGTTRVIHELMGNFQDEAEGGLGFLNMMSFDVDTNSMYITSFSPSYETEDYEDREDEKYNFYEDQTPYRVELDLTPMTKNVATDYFEVNTYAGEEIGSVSEVASGEKAEITWSELEKGAPYSWYATVTNEFNEVTVSDMWHFTTEGLPGTEIDGSPIIYANDTKITQGDEFEPLKNVIAIDPKDGNITGDIKVVENNVDPQTLGDYDVQYKVINSKNATATKTIIVTVEAQKEEPGTPDAPVIDANDITITEGDNFDPLDGVTASDANDEDITSDIDVVENTVDTEKAGTYEVTFEVTDSNNVAATKTITVTVQKRDEEQPPAKDPEEDKDDPEKPVVDGEDSEDKGEGEKLPTTATNMYTWLLIGVMLIAAAGAFAIYHNRRKA